ncbi:NUDIX domain-containing protein [Streptomyces canus]|uniref:NUDIX domain-containing protein n=1 Tax=Streptomyces canus TaxID=58343 RepID=UPI0037236ACA
MTRCRVGPGSRKVPGVHKIWCLATAHPAVVNVLADYQPRTTSEPADVDRVRALVATGGDTWSRSTPLHVTASALIVYPDSGRVLLRRHQRHQSWLLVGGHADPDEHDPLVIALREGREESGLRDLVPWPDAELRHVVFVLTRTRRGRRSPRPKSKTHCLEWNHCSHADPANSPRTQRGRKWLGDLIRGESVEPGGTGALSSGDPRLAFRSWAGTVAGVLRPSPPGNRPRDVDKRLYKRRNVVERCFCRLKHPHGGCDL